MKPASFQMDQQIAWNYCTQSRQWYVFNAEALCESVPPMTGYLIIVVLPFTRKPYYLLTSAMIDTTKTDQAKAIGSLSTYKPVVRGPKIFPKDEPKLFIKTYVNPILVYPLQRLVAHPYTQATKYPKINVPAYKMALLASTPSTPKIRLIPWR